MQSYMSINFNSGRLVRGKSLIERFEKASVEQLSKTTLEYTPKLHWQFNRVCLPLLLSNMTNILNSNPLT